MKPDIGQRVAALLRAMEEVILPAIDPAQRPAIEQAKLGITQLRLIAAQHDKAYHLAIAELRTFAVLLEHLNAAAGNVVEAGLRADLARAVADDWTSFRAPAMDRIEAITLRYRELADAIIDSPGVLAHDAVRRRVSAVVMTHSAEETLMRRAWMALSGVELEPEKLPTIDMIISPAVSDGR